jgi:hypothetical protein
MGSEPKLTEAQLAYLEAAEREPFEAGPEVIGYERAGWVTQEHRPDEGWFVVLTDAGKAALEAHRAV